MNEPLPGKMKPSPKRAPPKVKFLTDCQFANAVKIGKNQVLYISSENYDLKLTSGILSVRKIDWPASEKTVYTSISNMIYWR